jgi:hypothetical protein
MEGAYLESLGDCPDLEPLFPLLVNAGYKKTSEKTGIPPVPGAYNCIAWAAGDVYHGFWWPRTDHYWPLWFRRENTVRCFVKTFRWLGYRVCDNRRLEPGYEKVALYAMHKSKRPAPAPRNTGEWIDWEPKHMARQLADGKWTSKVGGEEDIVHYTPEAVEAHGPRYGPNRKAEYGAPIVYMKRSVQIGWIVRLVQSIQVLVESRLGRI